MADNIAITAGTGTNVATDERTINATTVHVQRTDEQGSTALAAAHVAISNSAANLVAARDTRKRLTIVNFQSVPIYVGPSGVTTSTGLRLDTGAALTLHTTAQVQAITAAAYTALGEDDKVHVIEEYDA